jgi:putative tryptophan/tyrosine transport system substrate-binding protein
MIAQLRRRDFLLRLGSVALPWPLRGLAQTSIGTRKIGVLMSTAENDPEGRTRVATFVEALRKLGWMVGRNVEFDVRWHAGDAKRAQIHAADIVAGMPDLIVANASQALSAVQRQTSTIPIVFVQVADPIGDHFVVDLAHPDGNTTGFTSFEDTMSAKWLQLLKEAVPHINRVALIRNVGPDSATARMMPAIQTAAQSSGVELITADVRDQLEIDHAYEAFARASVNGVITMPDPLFTIYRDRIIALAAQRRLPAMYYFRFFATSGGLMSYGPDTADIYERAASYTDRILKGARPGDLPIQQPTKFELVINLKTAQALGIAFPQSLILRATETIH